MRLPALAWCLMATVTRAAAPPWPGPDATGQSVSRSHAVRSTQIVTMTPGMDAACHDSEVAIRGSALSTVVTSGRKDRRHGPGKVVSVRLSRALLSTLLRSLESDRCVHVHFVRGCSDVYVGDFHAWDWDMDALLHVLGRIIGRNIQRQGEYAHPVYVVSPEEPPMLRSVKIYDVATASCRCCDAARGTSGIRAKAYSRRLGAMP